MIRPLTLILACTFVANATWAQHKTGYHLDLKKDAILTGTSLLLTSAGILALRQTAPLSMAELDMLNANDINGFDRFAIKRQNEKTANISDYFMYACLGANALLLTNKSLRKGLPEIGLIGIETAFITYGITNLVKATVLRPRPYLYNPNQLAFAGFEPEARFSFFSGHTSMSAAATFFAASTLSTYLPDFKYKSMVWVLAAGLPATTALLRVSAGKHFPTDVIAGYAIGAFLGCYIPHMHLKNQANSSVELSTGINGLLLRYRF